VRKENRMRKANVMLAGLLLGLAGCGGGFPKLYPIAGMVTWDDGKPLTAGAVSFHPDATKGNNAPVNTVSLIDAQGHYELQSRGVKGSDSGSGAPLGWYKVTLITTPRGGKDPEITVDPRYLKPETTPLEIEVVADPKPDAYDLKVNR
jgi:hypothetical protein